MLPSQWAARLTERMSQIPFEAGSGACSEMVDRSEVVSAEPVEPVEKHLNVAAKAVLARVGRHRLETLYSSGSLQTQNQIRIQFGLGNVGFPVRVADCVPIPMVEVAVMIAPLHDPKNGSHSGQAMIRRMVWSRILAQRSSLVRAQPAPPSSGRNRCHCTSGEGAYHIRDGMTAGPCFLQAHPQQLEISDYMQDPVPPPAVADCLVSESAH